MKTAYHGRSCLALEMGDGQRAMADSSITENPLLDLTTEKVKTDWLLTIYGYGGHIGDMIPIAKENQTMVISIVEIISHVNSRGVDFFGTNIGGKYTSPFGIVKFVHAQHSLGYEVDGIVQYMGGPNGIIIQVEGKTTYHAGDTAYFGDLGLLAGELDIDVALLPAGDSHMAGLEGVAWAAQITRAKKIIPIHFNTSPVTEQDSEPSVALLEDSGGKIMNVLETLRV